MSPLSFEGFEGVQLRVGSAAWAQRSGGRAGGGSFRSSPSRPSSPSRSTTPSRPTSPSRPSYGGGGPVVVPVPVGPPPVYYPNGGYRTAPYPTTTVTHDGSGWIVGLVILLLLGSVGMPIVLAFMRALGRGAGGATGSNELDNDSFTISKVQVALLAQARHIQTELNQLADVLDTGTAQGLTQLMQESILSLLRSPENWSHALVSSETVKGFDKADTLFSKLSVAERSKYTVETLTNVGGRKLSKAFNPNAEQGPASYIVVTLLVGTAHDRPIFEPIHSVQELQQALQKLASIPSEYLKVFEVIWTPQNAGDTLTYDELLAQYPDMVQL